MYVVPSMSCSPESFDTSQGGSPPEERPVVRSRGLLLLSGRSHHRPSESRPRTPDNGGIARPATKVVVAPRQGAFKASLPTCGRRVCQIRVPVTYPALRPFSRVRARPRMPRLRVRCGRPRRGPAGSGMSKKSADPLIWVYIYYVWTLVSSYI